MHFISVLENVKIYMKTYMKYIIFYYVLMFYFCITEKNEMGGTCGPYGAGERGVQGSGGETWGKETIGETETQMGG